MSKTARPAGKAGAKGRAAAGGPSAKAASAKSARGSTSRSKPAARSSRGSAAAGATGSERPKIGAATKRVSKAGAASSQAGLAAREARTPAGTGRPAVAKKAGAARSRTASRGAAAGTRSTRPGPASRRRGLPAAGRRDARAEQPPPYLAAPETLAGSEEERIESSKYLARDIPPRVFEEERFLFPESYSRNRVRLLVKDPEWLFAHWDVSGRALSALRADLGERALALSRLTLRVEDPSDGLLSVVLLPGGTRSWYLRTHREHWSYRAQLGLTTPAGVFHRLATSNVVTTPRVGASTLPARRTARFGNGAPPAQAPQAKRDAAARPGSPRPAVDLIDTTTPRASELPERGGASDVFGPAAGGEAARRGGASDTYRR